MLLYVTNLTIIIFLGAYYQALPRKSEDVIAVAMKIRNSLKEKKKRMRTFFLIEGGPAVAKV